jgi:hypothetical protein
MTEAAVYVEPLLASMSPFELNLTIAARLVKSPAAPEDNPVTPSMVVPEAVASYVIRKLPDCAWASEEFTHEPEDSRQEFLPLALASLRDGETMHSSKMQSDAKNLVLAIPTFQIPHFDLVPSVLWKPASLFARRDTEGGFRCVGRIGTGVACDY